MQLVITEAATGVWVQLEGETAAEMRALERLGGQRERTSGPAPFSVEGVLATRLGLPVRSERR